jgi:hypothetical protein
MMFYYHPRCRCNLPYAACTDFQQIEAKTSLPRLLFQKPRGAEPKPEWATLALFFLLERNDSFYFVGFHHCDFGMHERKICIQDNNLTKINK